MRICFVLAAAESDGPTSAPVDGPLANDADLDRALFGPYGDQGGDGNSGGR